MIEAVRHFGGVAKGSVCLVRQFLRYQEDEVAPERDIAERHACETINTESQKGLIRT